MNISSNTEEPLEDINVNLPGKHFALRQKLCRRVKHIFCEYLRQESPGEPDAGNPHVRFDEGVLSV